jgi:hypothetical protein
LKVQYKTGDGTSSSDNHMKPHLRLVNTGTQTVALSAIKIRYYFANENAGTFATNCDYASPQICSAITSSVITMSTAKVGATHYLEVGFTGTGTLAPGGTQDFESRFNHTDWSAFDETNDYSYQYNVAAYADAPKITVFMNDVRVYGTAP